MCPDLPATGSHFHLTNNCQFWFFSNYLPPLSATFVEAVNGLFLQGDGDCDERVVSARCHGLEVARYPAVRFRKCHGAEAA